MLTFHKIFELNFIKLIKNFSQLIIRLLFIFLIWLYFKAIYHNNVINIINKTKSYKKTLTALKLVGFWIFTFILTIFILYLSYKVHITVFYIISILFALTLPFLILFINYCIVTNSFKKLTLNKDLLIKIALFDVLLLIISLISILIIVIPGIGALIFLFLLLPLIFKALYKFIKINIIEA